MSDETNNLLGVKNVVKEYVDASKKLRIIDSLSYNFLIGKSYAIVGRSGIGKSTLLHLLGGLDAVTEGEILFENILLKSIKKDELAFVRGSRIGYIFQFHHLLPEFNACENVAMPLLISGKPKKESFELACKILSDIGLKDRVNHLPGQLSGGEQQRVAIARAVVHSPSLILADEPTGSLDFKTAQEVKEVLFSLVKQRGSTLILVTHDTSLASEMDIELEMQPGGRLNNS
jgi:lipoprotein-releasing system ATP-binding protein